MRFATKGYLEIWKLSGSIPQTSLAPSAHSCCQRMRKSWSKCHTGELSYISTSTVWFFLIPNYSIDTSTCQTTKDSPPEAWHVCSGNLTRIRPKGIELTFFFEWEKVRWRQGAMPLLKRKFSDSRPNNCFPPHPSAILSHSLLGNHLFSHSNGVGKLFPMIVQHKLPYNIAKVSGKADV